MEYMGGGGGSPRLFVSDCHHKYYQKDVPKVAHAKASNSDTFYSERLI